MKQYIIIFPTESQAKYWFNRAIKVLYNAVIRVNNTTKTIEFGGFKLRFMAEIYYLKYGDGIRAEKELGGWWFGNKLDEYEAKLKELQNEQTR